MSSTIPGGADQPTLVNDSVSFWSIAKGIGLVAIEVLTIADPPAAALLTAMMAVADGIVGVLAQMNGNPLQQNNLTSALDAQARAVLLQASGNYIVSAPPNAAPSLAAPVNTSASPQVSA